MAEKKKEPKEGLPDAEAVIQRLESLVSAEPVPDTMPAHLENAEAAIRRIEELVDESLHRRERAAMELRHNGSAAPVVPAAQQAPWGIPFSQIRLFVPAPLSYGKFAAILGVLALGGLGAGVFIDWMHHHETPPPPVIVNMAAAPIPGPAIPAQAARMERAAVVKPKSAVPVRQAAAVEPPAVPVQAEAAVPAPAAAPTQAPAAQAPSPQPAAAAPVTDKDKAWQEIEFTKQIIVSLTDVHSSKVIEQARSDLYRAKQAFDAGDYPQASKMAQDVGAKLLGGR